MRTSIKTIILVVAAFEAVSSQGVSLYDMMEEYVIRNPGVWLPMPNLNPCSNAAAQAPEPGCSTSLNVALAGAPVNTSALSYIPRCALLGASAGNQPVAVLLVPGQSCPARG